MEAEQSSYYREYPVAFGQKWEILGVGQSDTANNTLCRYCFQGTSVFGHKAPGAPVFGHCPKIFVRTAKLKLIPRFDPTSHASFIPSIVVVIPRLMGGRVCNIVFPVLRGNGTKIAPTGDIFDQPPGGMSWIRGKLADHVGDHVVLSPEEGVLVIPGDGIVVSPPSPIVEQLETAEVHSHRPTPPQSPSIPFPFIPSQVLLSSTGASFAVVVYSK